MRKLKRYVSGFLAVIMLSAVIAPLIEVIDVHAASALVDMQYEDGENYHLAFPVQAVKEFTVGTKALGNTLVYLRIAHGDEVYGLFNADEDCTPASGKVWWEADNGGDTYQEYDSYARPSSGNEEFGYAYMQKPDNLTTYKGYNLYCDWLTNIRRTNGMHISKINNIDIDDIPTELAASLGLSDVENELYPIWAIQQGFVGSNSDSNMVFMACDYDITHNKFVYYTVVAERDDGDKDNFLSAVFTADQFAVPPLNNNYIDDETDNVMKEVDSTVNTWHESEDTFEDIVMINTAQAVKAVIGIDQDSIFKKIFEEGSINNYLDELKIVDKMLEYDAHDTEVGINNRYGIAAIEDNLGDNYTGITILDLQSNNYDSQDSSYYLSSKITFEFTDEFLWSGDITSATDGTVIIPYHTDKSDGQNAVSSICGEIVNGLCSADPTQVSITLDNLISELNDQPSLRNGFLHSFLSEYRDSINDAIERSTVTQTSISDGELDLPANATNYDIIQAMLRYSIQQSVKNEALASAVVFNGKTYGISRSVDGTQTGVDYDLKHIWDSLTEFQRAILTTAYVEKLKAIDESSYSSTVLPLVYNAYSTYVNESNYVYTDLGSGGRPEHVTPEYVNALIAEYNEADLVNTGMVTNVARNSNVLAHYVVASSLYNNSAEDVSGLYGIYDYNLEALIKVQWTYKASQGVDAQQDYFSYLPSTLSLYGNQGDKYTVMLDNDDNWLRLANLLYNTEYAFSTLAFSEFGGDAGCTPEQVQEWFKTGGGEGVFAWLEASQGLSAYEQSALTMDFNNDSFSKNMLRSIIELHDMCEFLGIGIGDWSESIDMYLQIYEDNKTFFDNLRQNPHIYTRIEQVEQSTTEPLAMFFTLDSKTVSDDWAKGFAMSALYVPMETNLYDASSVSFINDGEWTSDFYYKYGFYRKALYISTDNSAVVNKFVSNTSSDTRPATLNDLLNYERDIILTIDDNFYNADEISDVISNLDYTGMRNTASTESTAQGLDAVGHWVSDSLDLSAEEVLKTGPSSYYSETLVSNVRKFGESEDTFDITANMVDAYVLSQEDLIGDENVFDAYEYSPKVSYGVVSSVYRSADLYNETLRSLVTDNAIFKSSKAICNTPGTTSSDWRSIYNYCMLANLEEQMKNDTASTLDLDAPIFCDLFGNIVTESGLVIIPAASNATLCGTNWTPYTVGFAEYYNNGNHLNVTEFGDNFNTWMIGRKYTTNTKGSAEENTIDLDSSTKKENAGGYFDVDTNGDLVLKATSMTSGNLSAVIQWNTLNKNSTVIKQIFFNDAYFDKAAKLYGPVFVNLIIEVMRGAPIEYIDYTFEGLDGNQNISKYGIYMAYKFEELLDAIMPSTNGEATGGNAVVTMPNLAFMPGVETIMLYAFKIVFAVFIVALVIQLYLDAVKNHLGFKSVGKFIVTCLMVIAAFTVVPTLITWSYYNANKTLLKDEVGEIAMLNYVKEFDGAEIGITSVRTPETQTELYIKLDDVSIEWWTIIGDVLFGNTYKSVTELYEAQSTNHPYANYSNMVTKGSGMYLSVQDIFDSTDINYRPTSGVITNTMYTYAQSNTGVVSTNAPLSYTMPYYVFLDQIIANINEYNNARDITTYSWTIGSNGHIMTYDVCTPYFTSAEFLDEGMDILGLDRIVGTGSQRPLYNFAFQGGVVNLDAYGNQTSDPNNIARTVRTGDIDRMSRSLWYPHEDMSIEVRQQKVDELYEAARDYIADNQDVLGKVPDEVFIKVMALQLAIEYNRIFDVSYGNSIEIMNVDTRDLMRFMVAESDQVYKYYSYSFSRFTYEQAGGLGVIFSALLMVVLWLTGFIKPLFMILILGLLIINCVFRKVLFRKDSRCIEGYLIGCACLVLTNYAYAGMLKVTMLISNLGLGSILSLLVGFIVQVTYIALLCLIMYIEVKDWKNNGFNEFAAIGGSITSGMLKARNLAVDKLMTKMSQSYRDSAGSRRYRSDNYSRETLEQMHERDAEREENGTYSIT